jgi:hypothetical protein
MIPNRPDFAGYGIYRDYRIWCEDNNMLDKLNDITTFKQFIQENNIALTISQKYFLKVEFFSNSTEEL